MALCLQNTRTGQQERTTVSPVHFHRRTLRGRRSIRLMCPPITLTDHPPSEYSNWTRLIGLIAHDNRFSGTLPEQDSAWAALGGFTVSNNQLTGTLPPGYASWSLLGQFNVDSN